MQGGYHSYRITKAALSAVTRIFASELEGHNIKVNACCPGWRQTEKGGVTAPAAADEGNATVVKLATLPDDGPTGRFFKDKKSIPW
jgi:NAD(P)-dependent dehydrogenase (short-subunit alcohol dehydrogenase family)